VPVTVSQHDNERVHGMRAFAAIAGLLTILVAVLPN